MKAMEDETGYDKFIFFPPPLNFLLLPLVLVAPSRRAVQRIGPLLTYAFFWVENVLLLVVFFLYMLAHDPVIYVKTLFQITTKIDGLGRKLAYLTGWTVLGFAYLIWVNLADTGMLVNILCLENSVVFDQGEEERHKQEQIHFHIHRNVVRALAILKEIGDSTSTIFEKQLDFRRLQTQKLSWREKLKTQQDQEMSSDEVFRVRSELIIAVYEELSAQDPAIQKQRMREQLLQGPVPPKAVTTHRSEREEPQVSAELRSILSKMMLSKNRDKIWELIDYIVCEKEKSNHNPIAHRNLDLCYPTSEEESHEVDMFIAKVT